MYHRSKVDPFFVIGLGVEVFIADGGVESHGLAFFLFVFLGTLIL
jgi:hypothetical protein